MNIKRPTAATTTTTASGDDNDDESTGVLRSAAAPSTQGIFSPFSQAANKKPVTQRLGSPVVAEAQTTTICTSKTVNRRKLTAKTPSRTKKLG